MTVEIDGQQHEVTVVSCPSEPPVVNPPVEPSDNQTTTEPPVEPTDNQTTTEPPTDNGTVIEGPVIPVEPDNGTIIITNDTGPVPEPPTDESNGSINGSGGFEPQT